MGIKIPRCERPRERFLRYGGDSLSLTELIAICLGSGSKGVSSLDLANILLSKFGTLPSLCEATVEDLMSIKGIGLVKAIHLKSVLALGKRLSKVGGAAKYRVSSPDDLYGFLAPEISREKQEVAILILRDSRGSIFHHEVLGKGTLSEVIVHPREVFACAIKHRAYSIILAHNHPSGDPSPSQADIDLTATMEASGNVIGIPLDDHLIVGSNSYISMYLAGYIRRPNVYNSLLA